MFMKRLKRLQTKLLFGLLALVMAMAFFFSGAQLVNVSADTQSQETGITYIDTEVDGIAFVQHPTVVFFGFRLTESDYDDYGKREGDYANTGLYDAYNAYITSQLSYWKNFFNMNSEKVIFDQLYTYWNGSAVGAWFTNTVAHRSTLARLEYGFVISIPAGTTFPCLQYVVDGLEGTPVMYRTTTDKAFYYDGSEFAPISYKAAEERIKASETLDMIKYHLYNDAEQDKVAALVEDTKEQIKTCLSTYDVQDVMAAFEAALDKIMTKEDYAQLAVLTEQGKQELSTFFGGLNKDNYTAENWAKIVGLQSEVNEILDSLVSLDAVDDVVNGVKTAVGNILTKDKASEFVVYCEKAATSLEGAFNQSLYLEAEKAQGLAWIAEGKQAIAKATGYDEVDAIVLSYRLKLSSLKTQAQWEEERVEEENSSTSEEILESSSSSKENVKEEKSGCGSVVSGYSMIFVVGLAATSMAIKKRKKVEYKNEK